LLDTSFRVLEEILVRFFFASNVSRIVIRTVRTKSNSFRLSDLLELLDSDDRDESLDFDDRDDALDFDDDQAEELECDRREWFERPSKRLFGQIS
jgi:hypothetical protein